MSIENPEYYSNPDAYENKFDGDIKEDTENTLGKKKFFPEYRGTFSLRDLYTVRDENNKLFLEELAKDQEVIGKKFSLVFEKISPEEQGSFHDLFNQLLKKMSDLQSNFFNSGLPIDNQRKFIYIKRFNKKIENILENFLKQTESAPEDSYRKLQEKVIRLLDTLTLFSEVTIVDTVRPYSQKEELLDAKFKITCAHAESISQEDKSQMFRIYSENYDQNPRLRDFLLENFEKKFLNNRSTEFYYLKKDDEIIAFLTYEILKSIPKDVLEVFPHTYTYETEQLESFNVDKRYQSTLIGEIFLRKSIGHNFDASNIIANCSAHNPIISMYIENNFIATKYYEFEGNPSVQIAISDIHTYDLQELTEEQIVELSNENDENMKIVNSKTQSELPLELLNQGYVLVRNFKHKDGLWYAGFVKNFPETPDNY